MTTHDSIEDGHDTDAKLSLQRRQQLSALVDGELAPDQARFLLRRLGHDAELAGRWDRWHLVGDVLRGQPIVALPAGADGFAARVSAALAAEPAAAVAGRRSRWQHGVGIALAASVAAVALFMARPLSVDGDLPGSAIAVDAALASPVAGIPAPTAPLPGPVEPVREVSVPQAGPVRQRGQTGQPMTALAAEPRSDSQAGRSAGVQAPVDPAILDAMPDRVLASADPAGEARPFASPAEPQARPWPRAILPGLDGPAAGSFTVDFGDTVEAPSFYPFEPQLPERTADPEKTR